MSRTALVITNIPTPYRLPLFGELSRQLTACGWRLKVVFAATGYARRQWVVDLEKCGFDFEVLHSRPFLIGGRDSASFSYPGINALLRREHPDVIVVVGYSMATMKLWLRSLFRPTPYVIWSGTIDNVHDPVSWLRTWQRRVLVSRARGFVAYGSRAKAYLTRLGAPADRVHIAINTVDTEFFVREATRLRTGPPGPEFLYIGNLTEGKRVDLLLKAFARVASTRPAVHLRLVGDGPMRPALEKMCRDAGIESQVSFEGFRQRADIPSYLARAAGFLFPSQYDVWGLVLVEAMAAGLPCVASIHSGATADLIREGVTGYAVEFENVDSVAEKLARLLDYPDEARQMGAAARDFIQEHVSLRVSAAGFVRAIVTAAGPPVEPG
jgi:glycosyltransferase involved in cell wall biosynthesis